MSDQRSTQSIKSNLKAFLEGAASLFFGLLLVLMVRSSGIEAFKIPSGSMIPTLLVGDHIFVNKFAYGLKVPFVEWFSDEPMYIFKGDQPKRGDIIVFKFPDAPADETVYYIKRVIGLPGETIDMVDKFVYVNGTKIEQEPVTAEQEKEITQIIDERHYTIENLHIVNEKIQDRNHIMMNDSYNTFPKVKFPLVVPEGHFFVLGDNRDHSNDSRFWGFVPENNIKGRAFVIWLSVWLDFTNSDYIFRPTRTGTVLH